jgi:branched-chain amino acid transport system substrate-binding protein
MQWTRLQAVVVIVVAVVAAAGGYFAGTTVQPAARTVTATITGVATTPVAGPPIVFGVTLPLSGWGAAYGELMLAGFNLAVEKINLEGGILGRPVTLKLYDDTADPAKIPALYTKLIVEDKVDILVGPFCTFLTYPAFAVAEKYNKPLFVTCSLFLPPGEESPLFINPFIEAGALGGGYVEGVRRLFEDFDKWNYKGCEKPKRIALLLADNPAGVDLEQNWAPKWEAMGFEVVYMERYDVTITDFTPYVLRIKAAKPDVAFLHMWFDGGVVIQRQWQEQGAKTPFVFNEAATYTEWFLNPARGGLSPEQAEGVIGYGLHAFSTEYHGGWADWLRENYVARYGGLPSVYLAASSFGALEYAYRVVNKAGSLDNDAILEVVRTRIDIATGPVQLDENSANVLMRYTATQIQNGKFETIWPLDIATAQPEYYCPT